MVNAPTQERKKLKDMLKYDFHTLGYAEIASEYLKKGGKGGVLLAKKCLEKILGGIGKSDPWEVRTLTDEKVIAQTIENQLGDYNRCKSEETIGELVNYFSGVFEGYSEGGTARVKEKLKDFLGMTYAELSFEIEKIQDKINGVKVGRTTKEDAEAAKKVLETYQEVFSTIMLGESPRMNAFKSEVEYEFNKDTFKMIYPIKEQEKKVA